MTDRNPLRSKGEMLIALEQLAEVMQQHNLGTLNSIGISQGAFECIMRTATPDNIAVTPRSQLVIALPHGPCAIEIRDEPKWKP